jgi:hypothetical protein
MRGDDGSALPLEAGGLSTFASDLGGAIELEDLDLMTEHLLRCHETASRLTMVDGGQ